MKYQWIIIIVCAVANNSFGQITMAAAENLLASGSENTFISTPEAEQNESSKVFLKAGVGYLQQDFYGRVELGYKYGKFGVVGFRYMLHRDPRNHPSSEIVYSSSFYTVNLGWIIDEGLVRVNPQFSAGAMVNRWKGYTTPFGVPESYNRRSTWLIVGFGVNMDFEIGDHLMLGAGGEIMATPTYFSVFFPVSANLGWRF